VVVLTLEVAALYHNTPEASGQVVVSSDHPPRMPSLKRGTIPAPASGVTGPYCFSPIIMQGASPQLPRHEQGSRVTASSAVVEPGSMFRRYASDFSSVSPPVAQQEIESQTCTTCRPTGRR